MTHPFWLIGWLINFNTCFINEVTFYSNGCLNRRNCRFIGLTPHWLIEDDTQNLGLMLGWFNGISDYWPFFIQRDLNHEMYLDMLSIQVLPWVFEIAVIYAFSVLQHTILILFVNTVVYWMSDWAALGFRVASSFSRHDTPWRFCCSRVGFRGSSFWRHTVMQNV